MNDCVEIRSGSVFRALQAEGALSATMARYYSPAIGRFISEDPIINFPSLYAYVYNRPTMYIDPLGLVGWNCSATVGSFGVVLSGLQGLFNCISDCVGKIRVRALVRGRGFGVGVGPGLPGGFSISNVHLEDGEPTPNAFSLAGDFVLAGASSTIVRGPSCTYVRLGKGTNAGGQPSSCWNGQGGWGLSVGVRAFTGESTIQMHFEEPCECTKQ